MAAAHRSFAEYVKKKFDNNFWAAAEKFLVTAIQERHLQTMLMRKIRE